MSDSVADPTITEPSVPATVEPKETDLELDDDDGVRHDVVGGDGESKAKKKRIKKKKKKKAAAADGAETGGATPASKNTQTEPPSIPIRELFAEGFFPRGEEWQEYRTKNAYRTTSAEMREKDRRQVSFMLDDVVGFFRP